MLIKTLRIHYDPDDNRMCTYDIYDRDGKYRATRRAAIQIFDLPKVKRFGFCPIDTCDVTLEFETPIDSRQIRVNRG